jgi:hypothetical protein
VTIDFAALSAPFPPASVSWRVGSSNKKKRQKETGDNFAKATKGIALAYIDARDVMDRLDAVCGPDGWQDRYEFHGPRTVCYLSLRIDGEWVTKADGAGDSDVESEKGAISDALKRAAVKWGIGRYLYHISSPWVDLDEREQICQGDRRKLEALLTGAAPRIEPREDVGSAAADFAIAHLRACRNLADLAEFWTRNAKGLRADLGAAEFARVEKAKDEEKARLTPADDGFPGDLERAA